MNTDIPAWQRLLWEELDAQNPEQQFMTTGEWIYNITRVLLPELGARRRENVITLIDQDGASIPTVAGQLGMRRTTISRLVDEGRSARKQAAIAARQPQETELEPQVAA
jgi:hypothetical protein